MCRCYVGRLKRDMTMEDREASAKTMFAEFLSGGDTAEALTCARELSAPGASRRLPDVRPYQAFHKGENRGKTLLQCDSLPDKSLALGDMHVASI